MCFKQEYQEPTQSVRNALSITILALNSKVVNLIDKVEAQHVNIATLTWFDEALPDRIIGKTVAADSVSRSHLPKREVAKAYVDIFREISGVTAQDCKLVRPLVVPSKWAAVFLG